LCAESPKKAWGGQHRNELPVTGKFGKKRGGGRKKKSFSLRGTTKPAVSQGGGKKRSKKNDGKFPRWVGVSTMCAVKKRGAGSPGEKEGEEKKGRCRVETRDLAGLGGVSDETQGHWGGALHEERG